MKNNKQSILRGIGGRTLVIFIATIIAAIGILAFLAIRKSGSALQHEYFNQLRTVQALKKVEVLNLFNNMKNDLQIIANTQDVKTTLKKLIRYHDEMGITATSDYDMSSSKPGLIETYTKIYTETNSYLAKYPELYGFSDILLICAPHGHVMYTWSKNKDLGTNLSVGQYKDSGLAKLWQEARTSSKPVIVDMEPYAPGDGAPAMFMGMPVKEGGRIVGIVAIQISLKEINRITQTRAGMGKTGETFLVGENFKMRSDSFLDPKRHSVAASFKGTVAANGMDTEAVRSAFQGNKDTKIITDFHGDSALSSWDTIDFGNFKWAIITEINYAEVMAPVNSLILFILLSTLIILIFTAVVALLFSSSLTRPIKLLTLGSALLATGDISLSGINEKKMEALTRKKDELGAIGRAFTDLVEYMREKAEIADNIADGNLQIEASAVSKDDRLGNAFIQMIRSLNEILGKVRMAVEQVKAGSDQVSQASQALSQGATEQASSVEEISSSLTEINSQSRENAKNAQNASRMSKESVGKAEIGNNEIEVLSGAMTEIGSSSEETKKVVKVIDDIAFQINLLALNANVEAARAGKYGKGFAVVADEVRNLAVRSAEASKETAQMVDESVRGVEKGAESTKKSAESLKEIVEGISQVSKVLDEIALASNEQAQGVEQINEGIEQINQVTQSNTASAEETAAAAEELASQADELNSLIDNFKLKDIEEISSLNRAQTLSPDYLQKLVEQELKRQKNNNSTLSASSLKKSGSAVKPKDVIKLDDEDFGEF